MAQFEGRIPEQQVTPVQRNPATESRAFVRSSLFKYYIHDSVDSCRLQLIGELSEAEVPELSGCWTTAKTTLGSRKLLLDLRNVRKIDDFGKQWIISMANDGALLLPETFLCNGSASPLDAPADAANVTFVQRVIAFLRGSRTLPAQSSTQAQ
jgi:anti-anti-sigma regulatory factor